MDVQELPSTFLPVPVGEMAFALTYFVHAANGRLGAEVEDDALREANAACRELYREFDELIAVMPAPEPGAAEQQRQDEATLPVAFRALCRHYGESDDLIPLCARVLAFHLLTEQTAGAVLDGWIEAETATEQHVLLSPVAVEAIATVPLGPTLQLHPEDFRAWARTLAARHADGNAVEEAGARIAS